MWWHCLIGRGNIRLLSTAQKIAEDGGVPLLAQYGKVSPAIIALSG